MSTEVYKDEIYKDLVFTILQNAVDIAEAAGLAVTVEQVPLKPFAMGNFEYAITVRHSLKAVRALAAEVEAVRNIKIHCDQKTPEGLEEFMIQTTPGLKSNQQQFAECDQAYNDWYHKCRAEMGLYDWRELWAKGETPKQLAARRAENNDLSDRDIAYRNLP